MLESATCDFWSFLQEVLVPRKTMPQCPRFGIVWYFDAKLEINYLLREECDFGVKGNPTRNREGGGIFYRGGADFIFRLSVIAACREVSRRRVEFDQVFCRIGHLNRVGGFFTGL